MLRSRPQWQNLLNPSRSQTAYACVSLKSIPSDHVTFDVLRVDTVGKEL